MIGVVTAELLNKRRDFTLEFDIKRLYDVQSSAIRLTGNNPVDIGVPTSGTYTVIVKGLSVECKDLHINNDAVYCVRADDEAIQININLLDESSLKVIADKISNDIAKTEEWADNFFM